MSLNCNVLKKEEKKRKIYGKISGERELVSLRVFLVIVTAILWVS
jgi:hypothetical protein